MKKLLTIVSFVALVAISFSSCKKCTTCTVTIGGTAAVQPEYCASSDEVSTYESNLKTATTAAGGTTACTQK